MSSPSDRQPVEPHPVVPTQQARQGVTGHNVRYVLGFGIAADRYSVRDYLARLLRLEVESLRSTSAARSLPTVSALTAGAALPQELRI